MLHILSRELSSADFPSSLNETNLTFLLLKEQSDSRLWDSIIHFKAYGGRTPLCVTLLVPMLRLCSLIRLMLP